MDADMQFGEVEEPRRDRRRRPDRDKHFAVVACLAPREDDLPIFVDLDALRDMEDHAVSDISVELGGVLLGGQFLDEDGRPFVLVTDSLRAEHYESTKGSFKFTHDTWSEITRQREEFADLPMVGWYHTHPDWGVFLSSMDMFICDHFFNRELDVALVIDPCRGDRGWFQWTGDPHARIRRTGGFFLMASRHRQSELDVFAAQIEGKLSMANDPRRTSPPAAFGPYPPPVVHIAESRSPWQAIAVLGMLTLQFFLVAVICWRMLMPTTLPADLARGDSNSAADRQLDALIERLDRLVASQADSRAAEAQIQVLDRVVSELSDGGSAGVVQALQQQQLENQRLREDKRVYESLEAKTQADNRDLQSSLQAAGDREDALTNRMEKMMAKLAKLEAAEETHRETIAALAARLDPKPADGTKKENASAISERWLWIGGSTLLAVLIAMGVIVSFSSRKPATVDAAESEPDFTAGESPPPKSATDDAGGGSGGPLRP